MELHLYLISDSTGETVSSVARSAMAQFEGVEPVEHHWSLIRSKSQMEKALQALREHPGIVLYTVVNQEMRVMLKQACTELAVPCIPVLGRVTREISEFLGIEITARPGKQHALDEGYFSRMEAVNYALAHDDGQGNWELEEADIILVGASRTSKTPTCIYLAYRGFRAANIPFVPGVPLPESIDELTHTLKVGLTINPDRLIQIRKSRLLSLQEKNETSYVDMEQVKEEVTAARKYFSKRGWPVIDVTRRSVEETAASIIQLYQERFGSRSQG